MNRKLLVAVFIFLCLAMGCATLMGPKEEAKITPVITQSFASKEIRIGDTWKIYLNASDPNGEITKISAMVDQPGQIYPESITKVSKENGKGFSGYLYLSTASLAKVVDSTSITLLVQIQDRAGNFSPPAMFPLTLKSLATQEAPPQGVFREGDLGPVVLTWKSSWTDSILEKLSTSSPSTGTEGNPTTGMGTNSPAKKK